MKFRKESEKERESTDCGWISIEINVLHKINSILIYITIKPEEPEQFLSFYPIAKFPIV